MLVSRNRTTSAGLLIVSIILSLFVAFNGTDTNVQIAMLAYAVTSSILVMFLLNLTPRKIEFATIGGAITKDIVIGAVVGGIFVFLNQLNSVVSLGAPQSLIALGVAGQFIAIVLVAPIVEEFLFRGFVQPFLYNATKGNQILSVVGSAFLFALFHFAVYGGFLGISQAPGIFVGAFMFGIVAGFMVPNKKGKADITTLERPIVSHMLFNFYLLNLVYGFVAFLV